MKARIPSHREFIINFPDSVDNAKANEGWAKLQQIVEDYKKAHNGASVYAPTFIEDEPSDYTVVRRSRPSRTGQGTPVVRLLCAAFKARRSPCLQPPFILFRNVRLPYRH